MANYSLNPYVSFIESHLIPGFVQRAVFHRLTGEIIEPGQQFYELLSEIKSGRRIVVNEDETQHPLVRGQFLIPDGFDPLTSLLDHYVARPIQNPAVAYRSETGEWILIRTSMEHSVYSRKRDELPPIIEEKLSPLAADIFLMSDGSKTLNQIYSALREGNILDDSEFTSAINFLTTQERQLIKLTLRPEALDEPYSYLNIVPRNLHHADRKDGDSISDFHLSGIDDAGWEFDLIEPTINHGYRFPHEALGGLDFGSRFCLATLSPEVVPLLNQSPQLEVLEVGGGTGTFARAFIKQADSMNGTNVNYHILDLSPALMKSQRKILSEVLPESRHFQQNATEFDLPDHTFDLIISNEVIADFPVAAGSEGEGADYINKYDLSVKDAPESFVVNTGAFRFIERAWKHLNPGGTFIVSEYGSEQGYAGWTFHLNHDEYSIHFGHLAACATKVGFRCRLVTLKEFVGLDDEVQVLAGREEHLLCLNHILANYGVTLPYAVIAKSDFERRCQSIVERIGLIGYSFLPLRKGYHFGPNIKDFFVLIMHKP